MRRTLEEALWYIEKNPRRSARRIISSGYDDTSIYQLISIARIKLGIYSVLDGLREFEDELRRLGWGNLKKKGGGKRRWQQ